MTLAARLRSALEATHSDAPVLLPGDHFDFVPDTPGQPAAVLIAITDRPVPGVLLTQRTASLRRHAGQVAFPGGRIDPDDGGPVAAALREAEEEIALPPACVDVIGTADRYRTVTEYDVTPVIGVVPPDLSLRPSEAEVAAVFEVPLAFLLDGANQREAVAQYQGRERRYYEILWEDFRIWGATAAMIVNLSRRLRWQG
jgi:8-oxo-dGTP pyrophosphatase MutT (NUDIX family)